MGKKRSISKHVMDAEESRKKEASDGNDNTTTGEAAATAVTRKKKRRKKKAQVKDPQEVLSYLSLWQQQQKLRQEGKGNEEDEKIWRFNKNTQSWLIRHMYDAEKVAKGTFTILVSYLEALKGASRKRVHEDAVRRALRYKNWEKKNQSSETNNDHDDGKESESNEQEERKVTNASGSVDDDGDDDDDNDDKRWNNLNDHEKRKEYKRTRKIIDSLKNEENKS
jgi:hypothetical protein